MYIDFYMFKHRTGKWITELGFEIGTCGNLFPFYTGITIPFLFYLEIGYRK